jgi:hypothetical protein
MNYLSLGLTTPKLDSIDTLSEALAEMKSLNHLELFLK